MESAFRRLTFDHPYALQRSTPVVGEPQKVECPWFGVAPSLGGGVVVWERLEPYQARLLRVDRQAVLAHPLGQHLQDPSGVIFSGYPDHEVVRVANQEGFSFQTRAHVLLEPFVQHIVQDDIGQERGDHAALGRTLFRDGEYPFIEYPGAEGRDPKSVHAALRLDCFLLDACVTSSSCSSSTFNSARHSGGVQRQPVRRSRAIASRVCSTISSHRPDTTAARSWNTASALPSVQ